jgi:hypothetical protein
VLQAEVPLLGVKVLELIRTEVKLVDWEELVQVIALAGEHSDVLCWQHGARGKGDRRKGCGKSYAAWDSGISKDALWSPSATVASLSVRSSE